MSLTLRCNGRSIIALLPRLRSLPSQPQELAHRYFLVRPDIAGSSVEIDVGPLHSPVDCRLLDGVAEAVVQEVSLRSLISHQRQAPRIGSSR